MMGMVECVSILFPKKSVITNRCAALGPEGTHHDLTSHSKCAQMFVHMLDVPCINWWHLVDGPGRRCSKPNRFAAASFESARRPLSRRPYGGQRFPNQQDGLRIQLGYVNALRSVTRPALTVFVGLATPACAIEQIDLKVSTSIGSCGCEDERSLRQDQGG